MTNHYARKHTSLDIAVHTAAKSAGKIAKSTMQTLPILLAGTIALSLNMSSPIDTTNLKRDDKPKDSNQELRNAISTAMKLAADARAQAGTPATLAIAGNTVATTQVAPSSYRVTIGDTVSSIAATYGLSTASVLALNGLGWQSLIFPGQVLQLTDAFPAQNETPATVASSATSAQVQTKYTITIGDTITAIASRFGVSTQDLLTENQLGWATIIYPGQTILIPSTSTSTSTDSNDPPALEVAPVSDVTAISETTPLTAEMAANAKTIIEVGTSLGVNDYGLVIALATAMQESGLRNLDYGDLDSLGLFQQRPSTGWGSADQVTDPVYASKLFFGGPNNPNSENTRGLLDIPGWQAMSVTEASQAVQLSAYPDAYAKWETSARVWLSQLR